MKETNLHKHKDDTEYPLDALSDQDRRYYLSGKSVQELAHLAKNIIQVVSGSVEIIELGLERKQYDRVRRSWDIFGSNFIRLKEFVLDLIKYTKQYPLQKTECDLNQRVQNVLQSCKYLLKKQHVKINFQADKTLPLILLDGEKIEDMIAKLITHALDNLPEHNGNICIHTKYYSNNHQIELSVCDDGPILTTEMLKVLPEPFERMRNMCGTGFDIPLAKTYVEQHDGYMEFESTLDKGNWVRVYLPTQ